MTFAILVAMMAVVAGAVASVAGFGIGSLLTPLLEVRLGMRLAVAVVAVPHLAGTLLRFGQLRGQVDRRVFFSFGLMSAAGGLAGALSHMWVTSWVLAVILGGLLVFAGGTGLLGLAERLRFRGGLAWVAGALSGFFGGLVGNQGGIRSAALLGFDLSREAFVATATAIGLIIDGARLPVYLAAQGARWPASGRCSWRPQRASSWAPSWADVCCCACRSRSSGAWLPPSSSPSVSAYWSRPRCDDDEFLSHVGNFGEGRRTEQLHRGGNGGWQVRCSPPK